MSDIILSGASNIVSSDNPMKAGNECFLCILCAADDVENQAILSQYFAPGMVVANSPDKELPVYPSMDNIVRDTIEATFNPDIDKTMHFDLGDLEDLNIFRVKLITDANRTSSGLVYTVNAGMCLSNGLTLLMAGHKRFALKHSTGMYHSGSARIEGIKEQVDAATKYIASQDKIYEKWFLDHCKIDQKLFNRKKKTDWYMTADEMLEYGIVDKIIDSLDEVI